jgi:flagellar export protein FliJ
MESLIRLHRWQVDERRRHLADLEGLAERLRLELARLAEEQHLEQDAAAHSFEAKFGFAGYIRQALERERTLEQSLADVETQIAQARDALGEAFQELKRYETAAANRERIRQQRIARREGIDLDALAIENFRRRSGGE